MKIHIKETIGNASTELEMKYDSTSEALEIIRVVFERERMVENILRPNFKIEQEDL